MQQVAWQRLLSPFIYATLTPFAVLGLLLFVAAGEQTLGLHTVFRTGDVELALGILLLVIPLFLWCSIRLLQFERLHAPRLRDHLRHCAMHYPVIIVAGWWLPTRYANLGLGLYYGMVAIFSTVVVVAILVNATVLFRARTRATPPVSDQGN